MLYDLKALKEDELQEVNGGSPLMRGSTLEYLIQNGDSIPSIAQRYKTTPKVLYELNPNIRNYPEIYFRAGKTMLVPANS